MFDASELYSLAANLSGLTEGTAQKADQAVRKCAADGVTIIQNNPATPVRTGAHKNTMEFGSLGPGRADFGATTYYAKYLEFGTKYNGGPRPHIFPAADTVAPVLQKALEAIMELGL